MTETSKPEYKIRSVEDFAKIPSDRLSTCLSDFADWLVLVRRNVEIQESLSTVIGADGKLDTGCFHWIDDDIRGCSAVDVVVNGTGELIGRMEFKL